LAETEAKALAEPGALTAALNWYRAIPLSDAREASKKVTVPTMFIWSDGDTALREEGARICGDYVLGEYRFEILKGVSHWILDEQPDTTTDLLLDWFAAHPAASRTT
jgi:pimeloyl-ACP methyl ester carboxylesterase